METPNYAIILIIQSGELSVKDCYVMENYCQILNHSSHKSAEPVQISTGIKSTNSLVTW